MSPPNELETFIANATLRWQKDPRYRTRLLRELEPTIQESLRKQRAA